MNVTRNGESLFKDDWVVASAPVAVRSFDDIPRLYSEIPVSCDASFSTISRILKSDTQPFSILRIDAAPTSVSAKITCPGEPSFNDSSSRNAPFIATNVGEAIDFAESI